MHSWRVYIGTDDLHWMAVHWFEFARQDVGESVDCCFHCSSCQKVVRLVRSTAHAGSGLVINNSFPCSIFATAAWDIVRAWFVRSYAFVRFVLALFYCALLYRHVCSCPWFGVGLSKCTITAYWRTDITRPDFFRRPPIQGAQPANNVCGYILRPKQLYDLVARSLSLMDIVHPHK